MTFPQQSPPLLERVQTSDKQSLRDGGKKKDKERNRLWNGIKKLGGKPISQHEGGRQDESGDLISNNGDTQGIPSGDTQNPRPLPHPPTRSSSQSQNGTEAPGPQRTPGGQQPTPPYPVQGLSEEQILALQQRVLRKPVLNSDPIQTTTFSNFDILDWPRGVITKDEEAEKIRKSRDAAKDNEDLTSQVAQLKADLLAARAETIKIKSEYQKYVVDTEKQVEKWASCATTEKLLQDKIKTQSEETEAQRNLVYDWQFKFGTIANDLKDAKPYKKKYEDLDEEHRRLCGQFEQCNKDLQEVRGRYTDEQVGHSLAIEELNRIKSESGSNLDDMTLTRKYQALRSDISSWSEKYFWGEKLKRGVLQSACEDFMPHAELEELSEDCHTLLSGSEDGSMRPFVAEAYLWKFIDEEIFGSDLSSSTFSKGLWWAHTLRPEVCRVEHFLRPGTNALDSEMRLFCKWKASTAKLIINRLKPATNRIRIPVDPVVMNHMVDQVFHVIGVWMTRKGSNCKIDLINILQAAIDFDSHVHEQWSIFYTAVKPAGAEQRHTFPFVEHWMETRSDYSIAPNQPVGMVISPALIRRGTASGDNYSTPLVLVPSRVLPQSFVARSLRSKDSSSQGLGTVMRSLQRKHVN